MTTITTSPACLQSLPLEIHHALSEYLLIRERYRLCQVSRYLREVFEETRWKDVCVYSFRSHTFFRRNLYCLPLHVVCHPDEYSWFKVDKVKRLMLVPKYYDIDLSGFPNLIAVDRSSFLASRSSFFLCTTAPPARRGCDLRFESNGTDIPAVFLRKPHSRLFLLYPQFWTVFPPSWFNFATKQITDLSAIREVNFSFPGTEVDTIRNLHIFPNLKEVRFFVGIHNWCVPVDFLSVSDVTFSSNVVCKLYLLSHKTPKGEYQNLHDLPYTKIPQITSIKNLRLKPGVRSHAWCLYDRLSFSNIEKYYTTIRSDENLGFNFQTLKYLEVGLNRKGNRHTLDFFDALSNLKSLEKLKVSTENWMSVGETYVLRPWIIPSLCALHDCEIHDIPKICDLQRTEALNRVHQYAIKIGRDIIGHSRYRYVEDHIDMIILMSFAIFENPSEFIRDTHDVHLAKALSLKIDLHENVELIFSYLSDLAALEMVWECVQKLSNLQYLSVKLGQDYLSFSPRWNAVSKQHPSLQQIQISHVCSIWDIERTFLTIFGREAFVQASDSDVGGLGWRQIVAPSLFYAGDNAIYSDREKGAFNLIIDAKRKRKFVVPPKVPMDDYGVIARLSFDNDDFDGWL